jgi:flagellar motor switch protein FliN
VAEAVEYEQFDQGAGNGVGPASDTDLTRLASIPMELSVEIGRTHMTVGETLDLGVGSVVTLERLAGETADLLVNGSAIARGEVVVIDEQYGLRVTEILDREPDGESAAGDGVSMDGGDAAGAATSNGEVSAEAADAETPDDGRGGPAPDPAKA